MITEFNSLGYVLLELDAADKVIKHYTIADELTCFEYEDSTYCYVNNGHGDVAFVADSTGAIVNTYSYNAYGTALICDEKISNAFRYTGEYYDAETGLYYLRARYMNPATGTFTQEDTYQGNIYDALSLHKYLYAQDNPVTYKDPTGNMCTLVEAAISAGGRAMQMAGEIWAAVKALRILKSANIIANVVDITTSVTTIIASDSKLEIMGEIGKIVYAILSIYITITGIKIKGIANIIDFAYTFIEDFKNIIQDFKNGNIAGALIDILILLKDVLIVYYDNRKLDGNQRAVLELTSGERKKGKMPFYIKEILYGWAKEYKCVLDYFGELFYLW